MDQYTWTQHALYKMKQYGLSEQRVRRVVRAPQRVEKGIVKGTIAVMQPVSSKIVQKKVSWKQEIWVMYQMKSKTEGQNRKMKKSVNPAFLKGSSPQLMGINMMLSSQLRIISAWRYPGVSPKRDPIPNEILTEVEELIHSA
jgi:hypothetical protein